MKLDRETIDSMSIPELEETLEHLKREDKYPHLACSIAYVLAYHFYYVEKDHQKTRQFYNDLTVLLDRPPGYGWCFISTNMLAGIPLPHYLHLEYIKKVFPLISSTEKEACGA